MLRGLFASRFRFLDPGHLRDGELELVQPSHRYAEDFLGSTSHPGCAGERECDVSPPALSAFLKAFPRGQETPDPRHGRPASYRFWMLLHPRPEHQDGRTALVEPPIRIGGTISLRISDTEQTRRYYGHIGYAVFPPARGRHYAERATRLLLALARRHGMRELWITTNPDNVPSRRTCDRLGALYIETVNVPVGHALWDRGEKQKCRYLLKL